MYGPCVIRVSAWSLGIPSSQGWDNYARVGFLVEGVHVLVVGTSWDWVLCRGFSARHVDVTCSHV